MYDRTKALRRHDQIDWVPSCGTISWLQRKERNRNLRREDQMKAVRRLSTQQRVKSTTFVGLPSTPQTVRRDDQIDKIVVPSCGIIS